MATEKPHWPIMGEMVSTFSRLLLTRSILHLQVKRTCIKSRTSSNLAALERLKNSHIHILIMGKCCLHASSFFFDRIIIKVAGNQDRHKSSDVFDVKPLVSMAHLYVF